MHLWVKKMNLEIFTHAPLPGKIPLHVLSITPKQREVTHSILGDIFLKICLPAEKSLEPFYIFALRFYIYMEEAGR